MYCHLCQEGNMLAEAIYWCQDCKEALCELCNNFHKKFKLSKNHIVLQYEDHKAQFENESNSSTSEESFTIDDLNFCSEHPDKTLKYFCKSHEKQICLICKRHYHRNDCDVENIEDAITETTINSVSERILSNIDEQIESVSEIKSQTEDDLTQKKLIFETARLLLQQTREQINDCIDELENDVLQKMDMQKDLQLSFLQNGVKNLTVITKRLSEYREEVLSEKINGNMYTTKRYLKLKNIEKRSRSIFDSKSMNFPLYAEDIKIPKLEYKKLLNGIEISIINGDSKPSGLDTEKNVASLEVGSSVEELEEFSSVEPEAKQIFHAPISAFRKDDTAVRPKNVENLKPYRNDDGSQSDENKKCQLRGFNKNNNSAGYQSRGYGRGSSGYGENTSRGYGRGTSGLYGENTSRGYGRGTSGLYGENTSRGYGRGTSGYGENTSRGYGRGSSGYGENTSRGYSGNPSRRHDRWCDESRSYSGRSSHDK